MRALLPGEGGWRQGKQRGQYCARGSCGEISGTKRCRAYVFFTHLAPRHALPAPPPFPRTSLRSRAEHLTAILTQSGQSALKSSEEYVKTVFDGLADVFEVRLVDKLGYRVPWQLFDIVYEVRA